MRGHPLLLSAVRRCKPMRRSVVIYDSYRTVQISAAPAADSPLIRGDAISSPIDPSADPADARFEVLGTPYSLLSVSLSASQRLYTRRGTLVGVSGKVENVQSTLSILEPFRRAVLGIPFLYQRISSTSPITALISTKSPITSFAVIHLDGTVDWMITQRRGLLAWTGHTLSVSPTVNRRMSLAHWGNSQVTGRGLFAVAGPGQVYQVTLKPGEEYIAYPGNVVAYTVTQHPPLPYRLKSSNLRFQVPNIGLSRLVPDTKFFRVMRESTTWRTLTKLLFNIRTTTRRTIWGDRLFLQFRGPTTLLLSSRAARINDVLTSRDVNEIAYCPPGAVQSAVTLATQTREEVSGPKRTVDIPTGFHVASVGRDGKVKFSEPKDLDEFIR